MSDFKLGICLWGFPIQGPTGVKIASELGFQGAEISFGEYEDGFPLTNARIQKEYAAVCDDCQMEIPALSLEHLKRYGLRNSLDSRKGMIALDGCKKGIETAVEMGIPMIQLPFFDDSAITSENDFKNTCEVLKIICEFASRYNLEVETENTLGVEDMERLMREVDFDNFKLMYDSQNYFLDSKCNQAELLRQLHPYVGCVHLKDGFNGKMSGSILGEGDSGFIETAQVILETQCTTWLLLENYYNQLPLRLLNDDYFKLAEKDIQVAKEVFHL